MLGFRRTLEIIARTLREVVNVLELSQKFSQKFWFWPEVLVERFSTGEDCSAGGLLPSRHRERSIDFRVLPKQTNKQIYTIHMHFTVRTPAGVMTTHSHSVYHFA